MPARESPARVRPVGPARRFSARYPASPGVACSTLVPRRARLASARRSGARNPSQCPAAHRPSASSQYPMAVTARRLDSRHPSQYPEAHGPSVPRARLDASWWRRATCLPSRAELPASEPAGPGSSAERDSACPGRPAFLAGEERDARILVITFDASVHDWAKILRTSPDEPGVEVVPAHPPRAPGLPGGAGVPGDTRWVSGDSGGKQAVPASRPHRFDPKRLSGRDRCPSKRVVPVPDAPAIAEVCNAVTIITSI